MRLIDADRLKQDLDMCIETSKILQDSNKSDLIFAHHIYELESFKRIIDLQTIIDAEPVRHGHWILSKTIDGYSSYRCSVCSTEEKNRYFYCHWGAKMDEE